MTKKFSQACTIFFRHPAQYSVSQSTSLLTWNIFIKTSGILIRSQLNSHTNLCGFLSFPKVFIEVYIMQEAATLISFSLALFIFCLKFNCNKELQKSVQGKKHYCSSVWGLLSFEQIEGVDLLWISLKYKAEGSWLVSISTVNPCAL